MATRDEILALTAMCPDAQKWAENLYDRLSHQRRLSVLKLARKMQAEGEEWKAKRVWAVSLVFSDRTRK